MVCRNRSITFKIENNDSTWLKVGGPGFETKIVDDNMIDQIEYDRLFECAQSI